MELEGTEDGGIFLGCVRGVLVGQCLQRKASTLGHLVLTDIGVLFLKRLLPLKEVTVVVFASKGHKAFPQRVGSPFDFVGNFKALLLNASYPGAVYWLLNLC